MLAEDINKKNFSLILKSHIKWDNTLDTNRWEIKWSFLEKNLMRKGIKKALDNTEILILKILLLKKSTERNTFGSALKSEIH